MSTKLGQHKSLKLSRSEFATVIAIEEVKHVVADPAIQGKNLVVVAPILVVNSNEKEPVAPESKVVALAPEVPCPISTPILILLIVRAEFALLPTPPRKIRGRHPRWVSSTSKNEGGGGKSSSATTSPSTAPELWVLELTISKLGRQVTIADSSWENDTCLALAQFVMLPQDVADLAAKDVMEVGSLMVMQYIQESVPVQLV
ncbi:hypothetical protein Acr_26g0002470 [Actinidia rufa]|uniref:Uncharacterized protein n=1 Tax=Actinidia rufa TaxID=165716 RepID=A0A7J0H1J0_9ERIC|nr:hypothetical protein Acr_26g0002470 [Actinidia rufa]